MKTKYTTVILGLLLAAATTACESFVEVAQPSTQLTGPAVFASAETATAAMTDIYAKMRDTGMLKGSAEGIANLLGNYTDELEAYTTNTAEPFYANTLLASNPSITDLWATSYNAIYAANSIIEGVAASPALDAATKDRLTGEALFMRALLHSYITGLYGDCPYIATTDYRLNGSASKMPVSAVYDKCIADLEQAAGLLPEAYPAAGRTRPNRLACMAVLSRLYLYTGAWAEASNAASAVLNSSLYTWEDDLDAVFLKDAATTIWQLAPGFEGNNTLEALNFIFYSGPPPTVAMNPVLIASFEPGDRRLATWTKQVTDGTTVWYHPYKYKADANTGGSVEYSVQLRLAEQYLVRAEARARQGELTNAKDDLDKVRTTAGLPETTATTAGELVAAIMEERRHELFTEGGHRFFDLKRTGSLDAALAGTKPGWDTNDRLWPLPQSELLANGNLAPQNSGY